MPGDFKSVLKLLYDEFGDNLIALGTQELKARLVGEGAKPKASPNAAPDDVDADHTAERPGEAPEATPREPADYTDAAGFEAQMLMHMQDTAVNAVLDPMHVVDAVKEIVLMAGEVRKFEEAQVTVRVGIAAERDVALARIEAQKAALLTYLEKSFDERRENFQSLFRVVDEALANDNMQALALGLKSVIELADSSPFKDLATIDSTAAALADPDHTWNF